jgi:hypothetical protein
VSESVNKVGVGGVGGDVCGVVKEEIFPKAVSFALIDDGTELIIDVTLELICNTSKLAQPLQV